jgi:hypothetical protein
MQRLLYVMWVGAWNKSHILSKRFNQEFGPIVNSAKIIYYLLNNTDFNNKPRLRITSAQKILVKLESTFVASQIMVELWMILNTALVDILVDTFYNVFKSLIVLSFTHFWFFKIFIVLLGVHCSIYKCSYNTS